VPLTDYVALVSLTSNVSTQALLQVAAAVQKQLTRDFFPFWGLPATVAAFTDLGSVPSDYHVVALFGDPEELVDRLEVAIDPEVLRRLATQFDRDQLQGVHLNEYTRQPFALVALSETWSVTVSHEILEMVADAYGSHLIAAGFPGDPIRRVNYLLEVCDPCQSAWYPVNGVPVSDFYTPRYFDPVRTDGTRYSFTGELRYPLHILDGGYVSFIDPRDSGLYQLQSGDAEPVLIADIASLARGSQPLRNVVDSDPRTPRVTAESLRPATSAATAPGAYAAMREASEGAALRTREALFSLATARG
jgi:hypothetical protein